MADAPALTKQQLDEHIKTIWGSLSCTGQCDYTWNGTEYVLQSGSCSGGSSCPSCPTTINGDFRELVLLCPYFFPDANQVSTSCLIVLLSKPILGLLKEWAKTHKPSPMPKKANPSAQTKKPTKSAPAKKSKVAK